MRDPLETHAPFDRLRVLCERLAHEAGHPVTVRPLPAELALDRHGAARNDVVMFHRDGAPVITVAHELAHVLTRTERTDHGDQWRLTFGALAERLQHFL